MSVIILKVLVVLSYISMIFMNYLANALPINNQDTGAISDKYPSYFTPSGFTFAIWGIIYLFLGAYVIKTVLTSSGDFNEQYLKITMIIFVATSLLNILWLLCWHYDRIVLSSLIMAVFLSLLLFAVTIIPNNQILIKSAFSLYASWLSVAFIANVTITIVNLDIKFFLNQELIWYIVIMIVGVLIVGFVVLTTKNVVYGLVFIWAYYGILMKNKSQIGHFASEPWAFNVTLALFVLIILTTTITFITNGLKVFTD